MSTATNVTTAKPKVGGSVYKAPAGTALPTDATTALAGTYISMGYISEDGVKNSIATESTVIKDWGGTPVCALETGKEDTFTMTFIESLNVDVLKAVHGDGNVSGTTLSGGISVNVDSDEHAACVWVIETILKGNVAKRIVIPSGTITDIGEIVYKKDEAVGYEVTITATADTNGNFHYEYLKAPATQTTQTTEEPGEETPGEGG